MTEDQSEERISKHEERSSEMIKSDEEKKRRKARFYVIPPVCETIYALWNPRRIRERGRVPV